MNDENRGYLQAVQRALEEEYGSEAVDIFQQHFAIFIEEGLSFNDAIAKASNKTEEDLMEDESLTQMG